MLSLGKIVRLQIQPTRLKTGEKPNQVYDPTALISVPELTLTPQGAYAYVAGEKTLDVHHRDHPQTRNNDGRNDLSVNFTVHYQEMRARYGAHMVEGCAGENILIACDTHIDLNKIQKGLIFGEAATDVCLTNVVVALPCQPFSKFTAQTTEAAQIKEALQFLDHGQRGFYGVATHNATLKVGAEVFSL